MKFRKPFMVYMKASAIAALFEHPLHRRELGSHLTNVVRALVLEAHGYKVVSANDGASGLELARKERPDLLVLDVMMATKTEGFEVVAGGAKKTYVKSTTKDKDGFDKTQWKRTAPDAKDLETSKVEDALFKMGGVEATEFVDQPAAPAARASSRIFHQCRQTCRGSRRKASMWARAASRAPASPSATLTSPMSRWLAWFATTSTFRSAGTWARPSTRASKIAE